MDGSIALVLAVAAAVTAMWSSVQHSRMPGYIVVGGMYAKHTCCPNTMQPGFPLSGIDMTQLNLPGSCDSGPQAALPVKGSFIEARWLDVVY